MISRRIIQELVEGVEHQIVITSMEEIMEEVVEEASTEGQIKSWLKEIEGNGFIIRNRNLLVIG